MKTIIRKLILTMKSIRNLFHPHNLYATYIAGYENRVINFI